MNMSDANLKKNVYPYEMNMNEIQRDGRSFYFPIFKMALL